MGSEIEEGLGRDNEVGIGFGTSDNGVDDGVLRVDVLEGRLCAACAEVLEWDADFSLDCGPVVWVAFAVLAGLDDSFACDTDTGLGFE